MAAEWPSVAPSVGLRMHCGRLWEVAPHNDATFGEVQYSTWVRYRFRTICPRLRVRSAVVGMICPHSLSRTETCVQPNDEAMLRSGGLERVVGPMNVLGLFTSPQEWADFG